MKRNARFATFCIRRELPNRPPSPTGNVPQSSEPFLKDELRAMHLSFTLLNYRILTIATCSLPLFKQVRL